LNVVPLADARAEQRFGGKAVQLGMAIRAGLPVPEGFALAADLVAAVVQGDAAACATLEAVCDRLAGPCAVRSSAIGEDSDTASFAGQHATVLNVHGVVATAQAVATVGRSAWSESARAYRHRVGAAGPIRIGVIIQRLVAAEVAGVLFTRNPITGADELVIEASWGLGEVVVQGLVVPDLYRIGRTGKVIYSRAGVKKVAVRRLANGGTHTEPVEPEMVGRMCLADSHLRALSEIARRCDDVFGPVPHDIEWAFNADAPFLLQRRPIAASR
jgi:pyruvate,water dikinase